MSKRKITTTDTMHWQSCNNLTIKPYTRTLYYRHLFGAHISVERARPSGRWSRNNTLLRPSRIRNDFQWNIRLHQFTYVTLRLNRCETHCKMWNDKHATKTTSNYVNRMLRLVWQLEHGARCYRAVVNVLFVFDGLHKSELFSLYWRALAHLISCSSAYRIAILLATPCSSQPNRQTQWPTDCSHTQN